MERLDAKKKELRIFLVLYAILIISWGTYFILNFDFIYYVRHFPVPITMVFGALIAGFTCGGGGAVAFPVFTKVLEVEPGVARDFSLAIQSVGMTFASITIIVRKIPIEKNVLKFASLGGIIGIVLGSYKIAPVIAASSTRLIFTLIIASFGISLYLKNFVFKSKEVINIKGFGLKDATIILVVGLLGGIFTSIIGTGSDVITFTIATLLYKLDEKVATPTTVIIMAINSIFGFALRGLVMNEFSSQAFIFWILCIPIVAFFAPLGARLCAKVSRLFIVKFLLLLISIELISTLLIFKFNSTTIILSSIIIIFSLVLYLSLIRVSEKIVSNKTYN